MARKKGTKLKRFGTLARVDIDTVTWANTFNANDRTLEDVTNIAVRADECGYKYFAHLARVWAVVRVKIGDVIEVSYRDLGVSSDALVGGVEVTITDETVVTAAARGRAWIVVRQGFDYDDEYYSPSSGTTPQAVYTSRTAAETDCRRLNQDAAFDNYDLLEFAGLGRDNPRSYDAVVDMPWPQWHDWLMDHGFADNELPGVDAEQGEPSFETIERWWQFGLGGDRTWDSKSVRYVSTSGTWSAEQKRAAAEHLVIPFYNVVEADLNRDLGGVR